MKHIYPMSAPRPQCAQQLLAALLELLATIRGFLGTALILGVLIEKKSASGGN